MDMEATLARDVEATLAAPLAAVFDHLAAPERLGDWLIAVMGVAADGTGHPDIGAEFALTLRADGVAVAATGDVVAYEPPWQVAYRLCVGPRQHVVRITCAAHDGGTRVRVAQGGRGRPLAVAVTGLTPARRERGRRRDRAEDITDPPMRSETNRRMRTMATQRQQQQPTVLPKQQEGGTTCA